MSWGSWYNSPWARLTHLPTGFTAISRMGRSVKSCHVNAMAMVKAKILRWATEPEVDPKRRVRSWHLNAPCGIPPFVKDDLTGKRYELSNIHPRSLDDVMAQILEERKDVSGPKDSMLDMHLPS